MGIYLTQNEQKMTWVWNGDFNSLLNLNLCEKGQRLESGLTMSIGNPRSSI